MDLWVASVDPAGQIGVGLGRNCGCRSGVLYAPMLEGGGGAIWHGLFLHLS